MCMWRSQSAPLLVLLVQNTLVVRSLEQPYTNTKTQREVKTDSKPAGIVKKPKQSKNKHNTKMGLIGFVAELAVLGFCAAAVVTNSMLIAACDFMDLEGIGGKGVGSFGLFTYQDPDSSSKECVDIPEDFGDGWFRTAQTCSIIALCAGAILFCYAFCKQCICPLPCTQCVMDLSATLVQVCLALVYLVWGSGVCDAYRCSYGDGGNLLILTQIFWLSAGCFTRCMRDGRHERRDEIAANKKAKKEEKARKEAEAELEKQKQFDEVEARAAAEAAEEAGGLTDATPE